MFYVYVHRRADSGAAFYVGKGKGRRAFVEQNRNPYWRAVVAKAGGYSVEKAVDLLDEEAAHLVEIELIDSLRRRGLKLTNLTDGGEGMSGYKRSAESIERSASKRRGVPNVAASLALKGRPKSEEHRQRLSEAKKGIRASDKARANMSKARIGKPSSMLGKKHRQETKLKISAAVSGEKNPFFGKTHGPEAIEKILIANVGRRDSEVTRQRKSAARVGAKNPAFGTTVSEERKLRQIASLRSRHKVACPHCAKLMDESNAKRWHFDNCKRMK